MLKFDRSHTKLFLKVVAALAVLGLATLVAPGKAQAQVSLFGGYSYMRASVPVGQFGPPGGITQHVGLWNGWEVSGEYKVAPVLGMVADFGGNHGTLDGANVNVNTYLFGPQISLPARVSPFVHVLFGAAHENQAGFGPSPFFSLGPDTSFATSIGGGIDVDLVPFLALRLIQADYLRTNWHGRGENQARLSAGIVLHF